MNDDFIKVKKSKTFNHLLSSYSLNEKRVLDIGCSAGEYLTNFGKRSKGIDAREDILSHCRKLGLDVVRGNIENSIPLTDGEIFDVIWCNNVFEHLVAPHLFLLKIRKFLRSDSLLILGLPVVPLYFLRFLKKFRGYQAVEHINFYTVATIRPTLKRAGYRIKEARSFYWRNKFLDRLFNFITPHLYIVAEKIDNFSYPDKRLDVFEPNFVK